MREAGGKETDFSGADHQAKAVSGVIAGNEAIAGYLWEETK